MNGALRELAAYTEGMTTTFNPAQKRGHPSNPGSWSSYEHSAPEAELRPAHPLTRRYATLDEKLDVMQRSIDDALADLDTAHGWAAHISRCAAWPTFSLPNQVLIGLQRPDAPRVAGRKVWVTRGHALRPAEERGQGISIFAPMKRWRPELDEHGRDLRGPDGNRRMKLVKDGFTTCTVYAEDQTTGDPAGRRRVDSEPRPGLIPDLTDAIAAQGYALVVHQEPPRDAVDPQARVVHVRATDEPAAYVTNLADHLASIAAGHHDRRSGLPAPAMTAEREAISTVLLQVNGFAPGREPAPWTPEAGGHDAARKSAMAVTKTVQRLLATTPWRNAVE